MNDLISRLKDATTAAGETISEVPELRLERARRGFLVPVAAAVAVGLAIVGTVVMTRGALDQTVATTVPPRFMVEARETAALIVRGVTDGAQLDRVEAGDGWTYNQVQAAPDNRTFYATMNGDRSCSGKIVQFSLDDDGRAGPQTELPVRPPDGNRFSAFTVSGDGTKVIFGSVPCAANAYSAGVVMVADAESGAGQTMSVGPSAGFASITASDDGTKIAYLPLSEGNLTVRVSEPAVVVPSPTIAPGDLPTDAVIAEPAPGEVSTVAPVPDDVVPGTLRTISSCRFYASADIVQVPQGQTWTLDCPDASEAYLIDTTRPGAAPRRVDLTTELDGKRTEVFGVRMSADGTRLIAGVGTGTADLGNPRAAIMSFDANGGAPAQILYRGRSWLRLLDVAAGGTQMLVQSELEIGVVTGNAYRKVLDIPGRVRDGVVAW
ncbi:hypothetical protein [Herbidospora sp. RD11066]